MVQSNGALFQERMDGYRSMIAHALDEYTRMENTPFATLRDAMRHSLLPPGKCVRGVMLLEVCRAGGGMAENALPFACALEMIHIYSCIHDDLPCMDDDDMRRGRPANHVVYGEDMALLAGSALLSQAFEVMLSAPENSGIPAERRLRAAQILAAASGAGGIAGGQSLDIREEDESWDSARHGERLDCLYAAKTGALFVAAAQSGAALLEDGGAYTDAVGRYGQAVGLAFQLADDLLDAQGDPDTMGKPTGSDENKHTFLAEKGAGWCRRRMDELTEQAKAALQPFPEAAFLVWLAEKLSRRNA